MHLFQITKCELAVLFQHQFVLHMLLPIFLILTIAASFLAARYAKKPKDEAEAGRREANAYKTVILSILLIYPGIATRIFSLLRCIRVDGVEDGMVLVADYSVRCFQGDHVKFAVAGFVCMIVYILGIPIAMFLALYRNRSALWDEKHPRYEAVMQEFGGLYQQVCDIFFLFMVT